MNMKKRALSLLLAVLLAAASLQTAALAAEYSDLDGHWAESYITELSELGYMTGYTDGTVRPDRTITACEAIALLSRFYSPDDATLDMVQEDYSQFVETYVDPSLQWAYDEIELCLAAGILSQNELRSLRLTAPIEKELLAVLLVRALQLTDEASALNDDHGLDFADLDDIAASYRGHIAVLVNAGIVEGNSRNEFQPHAEVTRAVVAAMIVRSIEYLDDLGRTLVLTDYADVTNSSGVITAASTSSLTFRDTDGLLRTYAVPSSASVTVSGADRLGSDCVGGYVTVRTVDGAVDTVTATVRSGTSYAQGKITEISRASSGYSIRMADADDGDTVRTTVSTALAPTLDGQEAEMTDLKAGMFVTITYSGSEATAIRAVSGEQTFSGTIRSMTYGAPAKLDVTMDDGCSLTFLLDLTDLPEILWGGDTAGLERLTAGSPVELTLSGGELTEISVALSDETLEGLVTSIVATTGGTTWLLTDGSNETHTLTVSDSANAYYNGTSILLSAIQVGDTVRVVVEGATVLEVYRLSGSSLSENKLTGTLLAADTEKDQLTVLNASNRLIYVDVSDVGTILDADTGKTLRISGLETNDQLVAYGSYDDATHFTAVSIVVE